MASNRVELGTLNKLLSETDLILSTTELPQSAPPDAANCSRPHSPSLMTSSPKPRVDELGQGLCVAYGCELGNATDERGANAKIEQRVVSSDCENQDLGAKSRATQMMQNEWREENLNQDTDPQGKPVSTLRSLASSAFQSGSSELAVGIRGCPSPPTAAVDGRGHRFPTNS
jgi:hypothetical protein